MKFLLVAVSAKYIHSGLAVYSLKANAGIFRDNVVLAEYTINHYPDEIVRNIYNEKPDVIGFSCYIWNIEVIRQVVEDLKKVLPMTDIWLGGPEVSFDPVEQLEANVGVKGVMSGEGEQTFCELLSYYVNFLEGQKDSLRLNQIAGITYRDDEQRLHTTEPRKPIQMDELVFPYTHQSIDVLRHKILYYETCRGCPFACSYCLSSQEETVRFKSLDSVYEELQFFLDRKVPQVKFVDRTFNCHVERAYEIWKWIGEHDNGVTNFHFEIGADLVDDRSLQLLASFRPGHIQFEIGVQTTNLDTIQAVSRKMDLSRLETVVGTILQNNNIHIHLDLIAGLPYENFQSFRKSFNDVYKMRAHQLQLGFLKVLKGTAILEGFESEIAYKTHAPYEVLCTNWLNFDEIILLKTIEEMVEIYYNSMQFQNTIQYLSQFFQSPFDLYERLALFHRKNQFHTTKHSRIHRYEHLLKFAREEQCGELTVLKELLTFDVYLREHIKTRPFFAGDSGQAQSKWRTMYNKEERKMKHLEAFTIDIEKTVQTGQAVAQEGYVLFHYDKRNPMNGNAVISYISLE